MRHAVLLIRDDGVDIDVMHTVEYIRLDMRIRLFQFAYQALGVLPLGVGGTVVARFGKAAGALQKAQAVIVAPCLDIVLRRHQPHRIMELTVLSLFFGRCFALIVIRPLWVSQTMIPREIVLRLFADFPKAFE